MPELISADEAKQNAENANGNIEIITKRELNKINGLITSASNDGDKYVELLIPKETFDKIQEKLRELGYHINRPIIGGKKEGEIEIGIKWY